MNQLKRLEDARKKVDEISKRKIKLESELEIQQKSLSKLEEDCRVKFRCEIQELPDFIDSLEDKIEKTLKKIEDDLGIERSEFSG